MKYLKTYKVFEGKLEDDYTWWFGENQRISPLINAIKLRIKQNAPEFLDEFYYRITNEEDISDDQLEEIIDDIFTKGNITDEEATFYLDELKSRNKKKNAIARINNSGR